MPTRASRTAATATQRVDRRNAATTPAAIPSDAATPVRPAIPDVEHQAADQAAAASGTSRRSGG